MSASGTLPAAGTMTAAVLHGRRDLRFERVPIPRPATGEVLLEVTTVGVCGTDAAEWAHGPSLMPIESRHPVTKHLGPLVMGHEFAGRVVAVGDDVDRSLVGRLVASCGAAPCGECAECTTGRSNVCRRYSAVGLHRHGALARYAATPASSCVDVEALGIDEVEAALVQPMSIAVHAARRSGAVAGDVAIVQGVGGVGAFLIHALASAGVHVVAVDLAPERLRVAHELGAETVVVGGADETAPALAAAYDERIPIFFEVTGTRRGLELALDVSPMGTTIVQVGIAKTAFPVDVGRITVRELSLVGTNAMVRETDLPEAARLVAARSGRWGTVASSPIPARRLVEEALAPMVDGRPPAIKTLVRPPSE